MLRKLNIVLAISIIVLLVGCAQCPSDPLDGAFQAIDRLVLHSMEAEGTPGLALAVTTTDGLLYEGAYGYADLKSRTPVTRETLFQIGSITKSFTSLGLMHLWDEGVFDPKKPVVEYLPWFSYFEIVVKKGRLLAITGEGGESSSGETGLVPRSDGVFQIGEEVTPEVLRFEDVVAGRALRAVWSGHPFFRVSR